MGDQKDLTSIAEYTEKAKPEELAAPPKDDPSASLVINEEPRSEKVDNFETLEEFSKTNPVPEPPAEPLAGANEPAMSFDGIPGLDPGPADLPAAGLMIDPPGGLPPDPMVEQESSLPHDLSGLQTGLNPDPADTRAEATPATEGALSATPAFTPEIQTKSTTVIERVKNYSDRVSVGKPVVQASFPFSLLIEGRLTPDEREKLVDLLSRENMGIREVDLEPQFAAGKILIPRISEYAGILLVQALRGARARIRLGPSDSIFATADTRADEGDPLPNTPDVQSSHYSAENDHPAEDIPVISASSIPSQPDLEMMDTLIATAALKASTVEAARSTEYQEILEGLQREIRYKAYRKGATAVLNFVVQLTALNVPTHYRLTATGVAARRKPTT